MPCGKSFWTRINLLRQNCSHPPANAFLIDFGVILRSKISILRVKARRKMRKCIAVGQFGSALVRLSQYQKFKKFGNALYCGCKLAIHHRVLIEIVYFHASDALSITFTAPSLQFYQSNLVAVMCSSAQIIDSSFKTSLQQVELSFTYFG